MTGAVLAQVVIPEFGGGDDPCIRENGTFCWSWVQDNWDGVLWPALVEHVQLTAIAVAVGFLLAFALALWAHRTRVIETPVTVVTGILYTIPSLALFQLLVPITGLTRLSAEIALVSYTLLILFRNTLTGLREVPPEIRDAAAGMGMSQSEILRRVELPLALPAIMAGVRIATVTVISLATIAVFIVNEGLGKPIFDAIGTGGFKTELIAGGGLAIALALVADGVLVLAQRLLTPWARRERAA
jgi:osmoprotectant transport system permease protein